VDGIIESLDHQPEQKMKFSIEGDFSGWGWVELLGNRMVCRVTFFEDQLISAGVL
jgi:hypothetical protein